MKTIKAQPGFQTKFQSCSADIAIGGAAAGVGKTYALLSEPLRYMDVNNFRAVIFRRNTTQIPSSLYQPSQALYNLVTPKPVSTKSPYEWRFESFNSTIKFSHLNLEKDVEGHQGAEYAFIGFDELTHFTESQFWYLSSRNRSTCGVKPFMRATCNPQSSGWVKNLVKHYIYPDDYEIEHLQGMPIEEMSGVIKYFKRHNNEIYWADSKDELIAENRWIFESDDIEESLKNGMTYDDFITSFSFIGGSIHDNKALLGTDKGYLSRLTSLDAAEKKKLLDGCWKRFDGVDILFDYSAIEFMFNNYSVTASNNRNNMYITADIALEGADKFVIMAWDGLKVIEVKEYAKTNGPEVISIIGDMKLKYNIKEENIIFDGDGVGGPFAGFFPRAVSFKGNSTPLNGDNYTNLRSQCYFTIASYIKENKVSMVGLQCRDAIISELDATRKQAYTHGKLSVIPKKDIKKALGGNSPDYADCLMMRAYALIRDVNVSSRTTPRFITF